MAELTASKEGAERKARELEQRLSAVGEERKTLTERGEELQRGVTDAERLLKEAQQELEEVKVRRGSAEEALAEQVKTHSEVAKEQESTKQILGDLKQKEAAHLKNLQSLEKAQKEARRMQEKKLAEAREALEAKEREVEELRASFARLQEERPQSGAHEAQLSQVTMEIADLRSKLHMEQALTRKHKDSVESLTEQNAQMAKSVDSISQELEKLQKEKANLMEEISVLKQRVSELEQAAQKTTDKFDKELSEHKASVDALTSELEEVRHTRHDFEASGEKSRDGMLVLEKRVKELEAGEERWSESHQQMKSELELAKTSIDELEKCKPRLEQSATASEVSSDQSTGVNSEQAQELKLELETEKSKNGELQRQIEALSSIDTANDAPGTSRRLRREKIKTESELANAHFEVEKLQRQVEKMLNDKETAKPPSSLACPNCRDNRVKSEMGDASSVESLRQDLAQKARQLCGAETVCQRCECELLEVKAKLANTETELKESQASLQAAKLATRVESTRALSSAAAAPSHQRGAYSVLHAELEKVSLSLFLSFSLSLSPSFFFLSLSVSLSLSLSVSLSLSLSFFFLSLSVSLSLSLSFCFSLSLSLSFFGGSLSLPLYL